MTEKVLNTLPTEKDPRDLNMEITEFLRKEALKGKSPAEREAVCNIQQLRKEGRRASSTTPQPTKAR